jgi:hypothetical protein
VKCEKGVPTGGGRGFRHVGYCLIPFHHPSEQVNQPKVLVDNDVSTTTNISVNRMAKRMKGNLGKYQERENATYRRSCAWVGDVGILLEASVWSRHSRAHLVTFPVPTLLYYSSYHISLCHIYYDIIYHYVIYIIVIYIIMSYISLSSYVISCHIIYHIYIYHIVYIIYISYQTSYHISHHII